jgi:hypothetical protein
MILVLFQTNIQPGSLFFAAPAMRFVRFSCILYTMEVMEDQKQKVRDPAEEIWALLREADRIVKETAQQMKETDRKMQETDRKMQETDRIIKETAQQMKETDRQMKETDRQMKETDRKISKLGGRFGDLVEHLVAPNLMEKFNDLGYNFGRASLNTVFKNPDGSVITEVDVLLENGDVVLAVEIKAKLTVSDVREHIERMEKLRRYADAHGDKRQILGATAGAIIAGGVKPFALKSGFYVLEQTGDTVKIAVPEGFVPGKW